ncbi:hypothetical protein [Vallitalea guaymasensis]|uniref:hypothetical protein n=1 Tax=Vallitalea guaymasensis TaxID=1185412 RepID=UPI00272AED7D|nr:hypothetical protein [Vallitalea guaymasensis]
MFYNLFVEWNEKKEDFTKYLGENLSYIRRVDEGEVTYVTDNYTVNLNNSKTALMFKNEDYSSEFSILVVFNIIPNSNWAEALLRFVGKLISFNEGQILLESNGDTPILFRENVQVVVDDSELKGIGMPFECLNVNYVVGKLEKL